MKTMILLLTLMFASVPAFAAQEGHGGAVVVWRNASGGIDAIQLADYWEGTLSKPYGHGLTILEMDTPWDKQLTNALDKLKGNAAFYEIIKKSYDAVIKN